jgi:hypothetical protein
LLLKRFQFIFLATKKFVVHLFGFTVDVKLRTSILFFNVSQCKIARLNRLAHFMFDPQNLIAEKTIVPTAKVRVGVLWWPSTASWAPVPLWYMANFWDKYRVFPRTPPNFGFFGLGHFEHGVGWVMDSLGFTS